MLELLSGCLLVAAGLFYFVRAQRARHYVRLNALCVEHGNQFRPQFASVASSHDFSRHLVHLPQPLAPALFETLSQEIEGLRKTERSYVPSHKKGGTIAYETLCAAAPGVVAFYQSKELSALMSDIVGTAVVPTPLHDQSSCSVLFYEHPGDHIGWHYDHNFYRGRHFTALVPLVNRGTTPDALSSAQLVARLAGADTVIDTSPNSLIVFEGARVLHKVLPVKAGERRVILSMTFTENPTNAWYQGAARRIKDTAFFGIRAIWT